MRKTIKNYEGYFVSNDGQIKSTKYNKDRILKDRRNKKGYLYVNLCREGKYKSISLHKLVANSFLGEQNSMQINHKDGNKENNNIENLEYMTGIQNVRHAKENGLLKHYCKINENVINIIKGLRNIKTPKEISKLYSITPRYVRMLWLGQRRS